MPDPQSYTNRNDSIGTTYTRATLANGSDFSLTNVSVSSAGAIANSSGVVNGTAITNPGFQGVQLFLDVTAADGSAAASPTLDITVQGLDAVSGNYYNIPGAAFEQITTSTSTEVMIIHPHTVSDSGAGFLRTPSALPLTWRISTSAQSLSSGSSGSSYAFTIGGVYIP